MKRAIGEISSPVDKLHVEKKNRYTMGVLIYPNYDPYDTDSSEDTYEYTPECIHIVDGNIAYPILPIYTPTDYPGRGPCGKKGDSPCNSSMCGPPYSDYWHFRSPSPSGSIVLDSIPKRFFQ